MVSLREWQFIELFFLVNLGQENVFYDILERKNGFLSYKKKKFKKSKNWHFHKGVTHGFGPKKAIIPTSFLGNIGQGTVFYDILDRKNAFPAYKNKKFKKSKNWHFSKGVNRSFWSKYGHFSYVFIRQYRLGKFLLRYSWAKKRLSRL